MCQSRAEGGQRCAAHTRVAMDAAKVAHRAAVMAAHEADQAVAAREDALAHELKTSAHDLPEHLYVTDDALLHASITRRDAEDAVANARRHLDQAVVDYAMTPTGRSDVVTWLAAATAAGDARKAARWANLLNQADDTVAYRNKARALYGANAGHTIRPARAGAGRARHLTVVV